MQLSSLLSVQPLPEVLASTVRVWRLALPEDLVLPAPWLATLSETEQARYQRYLRPCNRLQFGLACYALRQLLGDALNAKPDSLLFAYGPAGKPRLEPASHLHFNISHSGSMALIAFSRGCEIGVDVEQVKSKRDPTSIAAQVFCPDEQAACLHGADIPQFYRQWTAKEAVLKAWGLGLGVDLQSFSALPQAGDEWLVTRHKLAIGQPVRAWQLDVGEGYAASLALVV